MHQRLRIARELLREDGAIFVHIGEEEYAHLSMLMEQVFPGMKVGTFVWRTREGGNDAQKDGPFFSQDHEYILCYAGPEFRFGGQEKNTSHYANPDNDPDGDWYPGDLTTPKTIDQVPKSYYPIQDPKTNTWYPGNPGRVWAYATEKHVRKGQKLKAPTIEQLVAKGRILFPKDDRTGVHAPRAALDRAIAAGDAPPALRPGLPGLDDLVGKRLGYGRPQLKRFLRDARTLTKPLSSWVLATSASDAERAVAPTESHVIQASTNREATKSLIAILGQKQFDYPKPVSLIRALVEQATDPVGGHIVLDFFAGSGTAAQAVLELNEEDRGDRRFILVSSTEATADEPGKNVCRDVTRVRVARVMQGYAVKGKTSTKQVPGLGAGFAYLRALRLSMETVSIKLHHDWVWTALQLQHAQAVAQSAEGPVQHLALEDGDVLYVPKATSEAVDALRHVLRTRQSAVVYSWQPGVLRQRFDLDGVTFEKVPEALLARFGAGLGAAGGAR